MHQQFRPFFFALLYLLFATASFAQGFAISGTMEHSNLEGGCWFLRADDGKQYELFGNPETIATLRNNTGTRVDLTVEHVKSGASVCMMGEIVRVLSLDAI